MRLNKVIVMIETLFLLMDATTVGSQETLFVQVSHQDVLMCAEIEN